MNIQSQNIERQMKYNNKVVPLVCSVASAERGEKGEKGEKGDVGEKGDKGEKGEKGDVGEKGEKGEKGDVGEKGEKGEKGIPGITPSKASIVFKKNNSQIVNKNEPCFINGWVANTSDKFTSDSVNVMILNKGLYHITININVSDFTDNDSIVSFFCLNNKTNLPLENVSEVHIHSSPTHPSTGMIHGIINVESNLSFRVSSNNVPNDGVSIYDTSYITLIEI